MRQKIKEWVARYLPMEIVATITALGGAFIASMATDNFVVIVYAGTWSDSLGYYGYASIREVRAYHKKQRDSEIGFLKILWKSFRNLALEFGTAELVDSFFLRPFFMYFFSKILGNLALGIIVGKVSADVIFYGFTIAAYELRKKYTKD